MIARAGRIAARLAIEFAIAHVVSPKEKRRSHQSSSSSGPRRAKPTSNGSKRPPPIRHNACIEIARERPETTIALAGTRRPPRWLSRPSFARRMLDAGARELLVLARPPEPDRRSGKA